MNLYKVGKIVNTHGVRGEVKVIVTTDFADERFQPGQTLYIEQANQAPLAVEVAQARPHKGTMLVKFVGYDNINDVQFFRDAKLSVTEDQQGELEDGQYYYHQIIGLTVVDEDGQTLGKIKEILAPGANDVWVVQRPGQRDLLLPVIDDVVKTVDLAAGTVTVELLEGLD